MLVALGLYRLRNAEFIQFLRDLLTLVATGFGAAAPPEGVAEAQTSLAGVCDSLDALFKTDPSSQLSAGLAAKDEERDNLLVGIRKHLDSYTYFPQAGHRAAAADLLHNLDLYGPSPEKQAAAAETKTIESLLKDWSAKPELAAAATLLNLKPWTNALAAANDAYRTISLERTTAEGAAAFDFDMKEKRRAATAAYGELVNQLNAHYTVNKGAAPWSDIAAAVGRHTEKQGEVLAVRAGRKAAAKKAAEDGVKPA